MSIVSVLGESAVRSLALAVAVAVALRVLRVQHARLAKRIWTAVLLLALVMPALVALHIPSVSLTALWSAPRTIVIAPSPIAAHAGASRDLFAAPSAFPGAQTAVNPVAKTVAEPAPAVTLTAPVPAALQGAPTRARHLSVWKIGFAVYLAITSLFLLRVVVGLVLGLRLWRRAQHFGVAETDLPVRLSAELRSPATIGRGILLPLEAIAWDPATLRATLAHEEEHVREGDFYLQLAATLHHCFFWISPHAWWLRPQISRLSETICDRAAVGSTGDGLSYAQLLLRFAGAGQTPAGMVAMAQSAGMRERIERLIADPELTSAFRTRRGQSLAAAALLAAVAVAAAVTVHVVEPAAVVLAAPQVPAPPSADVAAPAVSPAPVPSPAAVTPAPVPLAGVADSPAADMPAPSAGLSLQVDGATPVVSMDSNVTSSASANVHTNVRALPQIRIVSPMVSPRPMALMVSPVVGDVHLRVHAVPQINLFSSGDLASRGYAIYGPDGDHTITMHSWFGDSDTLHSDTAKHPGGAILFKRDGKSWIIDDPALVKQAQQAYAHVNDLASKQGELGAKQGDLGAEQGRLGELEGELGAVQGEWAGKQGEWAAQQAEWAAQQAKFADDFKVELPKDFDKDVQQLTDSQTKLGLERDTMNQQQVAALEAQAKEAQKRFDKDMEQFKLQQPQREAWERQMREQSEQMRKQMEPMMKEMKDHSAKQRELGHLQAELGRQQGMLGREQHEASREADRQVQSLIDQAVKDGKAHPVQ